MNKFNKDEYNKMCAEFLGFTEHIPNEKRQEWNNTCYPDLPYYRLEYNVPIQFGYDYVTPTVLHVLYNNADKIPRLTEKIAVAKMKFDTDWNWIMIVIDKIEQTHITDSYSRLDDGDKHEFNIWNKTTTEICGRGDTKKEA